MGRVARVRRSLLTWQQQLAAAQAQREHDMALMKKIAGRWANMQAALIFSVWKERARASKDLDNRLEKALKLLLGGSLRGAFMEWQNTSKLLKLARNLGARLQSAARARCFDGWSRRVATLRRELVVVDQVSTHE